MLDSILRTLVPVVVVVLLGQAARDGLDLPGGAVTEVVTVLLTTGYYALGRFVEQHWPGLGKVFLSLGLAPESGVSEGAQLVGPLFRQGAAESRPFLVGGRGGFCHGRSIVKLS
jgi:hypothetical protein